jgi:hypothetical protein
MTQMTAKNLCRGMIVRLDDRPPYGTVTSVRQPTKAGIVRFKCVWYGHGLIGDLDCSRHVDDPIELLDPMAALPVEGS